MLFTPGLWTSLGLLALGVKDSYATAIGPHPDHEDHNETTVSYTTSTYCPESHRPKTHYETSRITDSTTIYKTKTASYTTIATTYKTTTELKPTTIYLTLTTTLKPERVTILNTTTTTTTTTSSTTSTTTTSTSTTSTTTVSTTITPPPPNPCPTTCSISAGTVNLVYWPTDKPFTYPSTYVDQKRAYTYTHPSVYMIVDTMYGYNTAGRVGPSATNIIFALDLDEVSTIVPTASATRQLTLNDLGTDCPQSEEASVIATMVPGGACDPILAAPSKVKSWALPCNACGRFGLFDPPYAVPPATGGLVPGPTTTASPSPPESQVSTPPPPPPATTPVAPTTPTPAPLPTTSLVTTPSTTASDPNATTSSTPVVTAAATKVTGGLAGLILSFFLSVCLL